MKNPSILMMSIYFIFSHLLCVNYSYGMIEDESSKTPTTSNVTHADIRRKVDDFDNFLLRALEEKYHNVPPIFLDSHKKDLQCWSPKVFVEGYLVSSYPEDRLSKLVYQLMDIQLEIWYICEVDLGMYNARLFDCGYDHQDSGKSPLLLLTRLSLDQTLIVKSRILWERIMNFIYYLETGEDLENKGRGKKSKKKVFFDFVKSGKWEFMVSYKDIITRYDDSYRTAEIHKGSVLRKEIYDPKIDPNSLLMLLNQARNAIWENILLVINGHYPRYFTEVHEDYLKAKRAKD